MRFAELERVITQRMERERASRRPPCPISPRSQGAAVYVDGVRYAVFVGYPEAEEAVAAWRELWRPGQAYEIHET